MITVTNNDIKSINAALIANNEALKKEVAQTLEIKNADHATTADLAINATQTYTQYCTNDATFSNNVASITVDTPIGLTMSVGSTLKVCFAKDLQDVNSINEVQLTYGGVTATIKSSRASQLVNLISHLFHNGNYDSTKPHKVWEAYTTLELMYTGNEWLVMGNPVLCSYTSTTASYIVYANGLIEQWGNVASNNNGAVITCNAFLIKEVSYWSCIRYGYDGYEKQDVFAIKKLSVSKISVDASMGYGYKPPFWWHCTGY